MDKKKDELKDIIYVEESKGIDCSYLEASSSYEETDDDEYSYISDGDMVEEECSYKSNIMEIAVGDIKERVLLLGHEIEFIDKSNTIRYVVNDLYPNILGLYSIEVHFKYNIDVEDYKKIPKIDIIEPNPFDYKNAFIGILSSFLEINWDYYDYDEKIDLIRLRINSLKEGASKIQKLDIFTGKDIKDTEKKVIEDDDLIRSIYKEGLSVCKNNNDNLQIKIIEIIKHSVKNLGMRCYLCNLPHKVPCLEPTVCISELCRFKLSNQIGFGNLLSYYNRNPFILEMLVKMICASLHNTKRRDYTCERSLADFMLSGKVDYKELQYTICKIPKLCSISNYKPYMEFEILKKIVEENKLEELIIKDKSFKDYSDWKNSIECLTKLKEYLILNNFGDIVDSYIKESGLHLYLNSPECEEGLIKYLSLIDIKIYKFLWWLATSLYMKFEKIDFKEFLDFTVEAKLKYSSLGKDVKVYKIIDNINPNSEYWESEKEKYGGETFFAFHGSGLGNWYSILKNGLVSVSNTKMMSAGAAYGKGIYSSPLSSTSAPYSSGYGYAGGAGLKRISPGSKVLSNYAMNSHNHCMMVVEIIKNIFTKTSNNINVTEDGRLIRLSHILFY